MNEVGQISPRSDDAGPKLWMLAVLEVTVLEMNQQLLKGSSRQSTRIDRSGGQAGSTLLDIIHIHS